MCINLFTYRSFIKYKPMSIGSQMSTLNGTEVSGSISGDDSYSVSDSSDSNNVDIMDLDNTDFPIVILDAKKNQSKTSFIPEIGFDD